MILYAITHRHLLGENETARTARLLELAAKWASIGVDYIQIREKDLSPDHLLALASDLVSTVRASRSHSQVLLNCGPESGPALALASGAKGVHLSGRHDPDRLPAEIAAIHQAWRQQHGVDHRPVISISCHTIAEVQAARMAGASLALFAPVFEKLLPGGRKASGQGLGQLAEACAAAGEPGAAAPLSVLALGGVTLTNAPACLAAGAAGIAAIRLFLSDTNDPHRDWTQLSARAQEPG